MPELRSSRQRACNVGSFAGSMRKYLVGMLDSIGLQTHLKIRTTNTLFGVNDELPHSTSTLMYPVFYKGENYTGGRKTERVTELRLLQETLLIRELELVPDALVVPLGENVNEILLAACERGVLDRTRVLVGFPHPSGGNGFRVRYFNERKTSLIEQVQARSAAT